MSEVKAPKSPSRGIYNLTDLESFKGSNTFNEILGFVKACGDSVVGNPRSPSISRDTCNITIKKVEEFMNLLYDLVDEIPPIEQPMRFGNKAFRLWITRLETEIPIFLDDLLISTNKEFSIELSSYLVESFGNRTRIDYGTGHETNIMLFFLCLFKLNLLGMSDLENLVNIVFVAYIRTMRKLQEVYILEPAGSHGVWGLDDFHCLLFVWGAAQLCGQDDLPPSSICSDEVVFDEDNAQRYLYMGAIRFIRKTKRTAPFAETSPMLRDISGLSDWQAVYRGLFRLFQGEVLLKLPVCQHILFGSLISCTWSPSGTTSAAPDLNLDFPGRSGGHAPSVATAAPWLTKRPTGSSSATAMLGLTRSLPPQQQAQQQSSSTALGDVDTVFPFAK